MKVCILASVYNDLERGGLFYENQTENLGECFFDSLFSDIDSLALHAGVHPKYFGYFRKRSNRFPYAIYYKIEGDDIVIWRILDCRQGSDKTKKLIGEVGCRSNQSRTRGQTTFTHL